MHVAAVFSMTKFRPKIYILTGVSGHDKFCARSFIFVCFLFSFQIFPGRNLQFSQLLRLHIRAAVEVKKLSSFLVTLEEQGRLDTRIYILFI